MALTLDLTPAQENRLKAEAGRFGLDLASYVVCKLGLEPFPERLTARALLAMRPEERDRYLAAAAEDAASLYAADLDRPISEREMTALTVLEGEPFFDDD